MTTGWHGTGFTQFTNGHVDRIPEYDPRSGEHLWIMTLAYRWGGPNIETVILDMENLLLTAGPGCYHCEQVYTPLLATRRCKGEPK